MNQPLPFAAQFIEAPRTEEIQMPAYDSVAQMSAGESYCPCHLVDTSCQRKVCWGDQPEDCIWESYVCDSDTICEC